jgi:hypothetical protein
MKTIQFGQYSIEGWKRCSDLNGFAEVTLNLRHRFSNARSSLVVEGADFDVDKDLKLYPTYLVISAEVVHTPFSEEGQLRRRVAELERRLAEFERPTCTCPACTSGRPF